MYNMDLSGLVALAWIGLAAVVLAIFVGGPMLVWWLYNHVSIVW